MESQPFEEIEDQASIIGLIRNSLDKTSFNFFFGETEVRESPFPLESYRMIFIDDEKDGPTRSNS